MAVPTTLHIGRPCMQCTPSPICGPGGAGLSPCRGLGEEGGGGRGTHASCWGGGQAGGGGGAEASPGPYARLLGVGGRASTLCHQPRGAPATYVHASTGWGDWAATPAHISTGGGGGGRRAAAAYPRPVTNPGAMGVL